MLVLIFNIVLFELGFCIFIERVYGFQPPAVSQEADAIIVLTGGKARLKTGLKLLENGKGKRLLISGVNPVARRCSLRKITHADPHFFKCCVDLGRKAMNTIGNAEESARWVEKNGYQTIFIVTSSYHMPRSLVEFKRTMPYANLIPYPVMQNNDRERNVFKSFVHMRALLIEYIKYLSAFSRSFVT